MKLFTQDILYEYYPFKPKADPRLVSVSRDRSRFSSQPMDSLEECLLKIDPSKPHSRGYLNNRLYHFDKQNYQHQCLRKSQHGFQSLVN